MASFTPGYRCTNVGNEFSVRFRVSKEIKDVRKRMLTGSASQ